MPNIYITEIVENINLAIDEENNILNIQITENNEVVNIEIAEVGAKGDNGLSSYQIAVNNGFIGTEQEWLDSLKAESIFIEIEPIGAINGINTDFVLPNVPVNLNLYLNGLRQKITEDFALNSNIITFNQPPIAGDIIIANYKI